MPKLKEAKPAATTVVVSKDDLQEIVSMASEWREIVVRELDGMPSWLQAYSAKTLAAIERLNAKLK